MNEKSKKEPQVYLEKENVRILMPMFRTRSSTSTIYQVNENPSSIIEKVEYQSDNLSGYVSIRKVEGGSAGLQGYCDFYVTRVCNIKFPEVSIQHGSRNRVFRNDDKHENNVKF